MKDNVSEAVLPAHPWFVKDNFSDAILERRKAILKRWDDRISDPSFPKGCSSIFHQNAYVRSLKDIREKLQDSRCPLWWDSPVPIRWAAIPGYEGRYEASTHGLIRQAGTKRPINPTPDRKPETVSLSKDGKSRQHTVARLVFISCVCPLPSNVAVRHGSQGIFYHGVDNIYV